MYCFVKFGIIDLCIDYLCFGIGEYFELCVEVMCLGLCVVSMCMEFLGVDGKLLFCGLGVYIVL